MNHDKVPEFLSKAVADISDEVATCAELVDIWKDKRLRERLADIYARLFRFYRDVMAWYLKSRPAKFIGSFNENLKDLFQEAMEDIQKPIGVLRRLGDNIGHSATRLILQGVKDIKHEQFRQRQTWWTDKEVGHEGGRFLRETVRDALQETMQNMWKENLAALYDQAKRDLQEKGVESLEKPRIAGTESHMPVDNSRLADLGSVSGRCLREHFQKQEENIVGDEGLHLLRNGSFWLADEMTASKLFDWMDSERSETLWISSEPDSISGESVSLARAAALSATATAWESDQPIISHFCARSHPKDISEDINIEKAGLIGLVYSLINQLQQTIPDESSTGISKLELDALDGSRASWPTSLTVLRKLLRGTPRVTYCVIDGLNDLEWGDGMGWCEQILNLIREHQEEQPFNVLLTTTGQSRLLPREVSFEQKHTAQGRAREVRLMKKKKVEAA